MERRYVRTKTSIHYILAMADHRIDHITGVTEHAQFRFEQGVSFARSLDNWRRNPAFGNPSPVRSFALGALIVGLGGALFVLSDDPSTTNIIWAVFALLMLVVLSTIMVRAWRTFVVRPKNE